MADDTEKIDSKKPQELVDLSALVGLTFGPSWSDPKSSIKKLPTERSEDRGHSHAQHQQSKGGFQKDRRQQFSRTQKPTQEFFNPTVNISFYPEDEPFLALIKAIRVSCKTYELFELANLILEKPERLVAVISPKPSKEGYSSKLFVCPLNNMPFESEDEALGFALKHYITNFFDVEEIQVDPPKGSFPIINRCGFTGELLGPPNYHRYQDLLKEHYANNLSNIPYDRFLSKIESVKDEEVARAWSEKMSKVKRYTWKKTSENEESPVFNTWEEARAFLLSKHKKKLVEEANSVRFHGSAFEKMPKGNIRRSFELMLKMQREFPLDTANNIRGRLRRMNLSIYKKGSKGITYVCAVKRKFRQEGITFAENFQSLVDFIEKNPNCQSSKLPELYLGIHHPVANEVGEIQSLTPEQQAQVRKLMLDLRWLVSEGYVTEYGNSTLYAPPPLSSSKLTDEKSIEEQEESLETLEAPLTTDSSQNIEEQNNTEPDIVKKKTPAKKKSVKKATAKKETSSVQVESHAAAE